MKYYFAVRDNEVYFTSSDYMEVEDFIDNTMDIFLSDTADEYNFDLANEKDYEQAIIQSNIDYGMFDIYSIDEEQFNNEYFELNDGTTILIQDIIKYINKS